MAKAMCAKFKTAALQTFNQIPIDVELGQRQIPGGPEIVAFFQVCHGLHPTHAGRVLNIMSKDDTAFEA
jgi:hypothetical protein